MPPTPAPGAPLVDPSGAPRFGLHEAPVTRVNHGDCDLRTPMGARVGALGRVLGYKRFHFGGLLAPDLVAGLAVVHLGWAANAFLYVHRPSDGMTREWSRLLPLGLGCRFGDQPDLPDCALAFGRERYAIAAAGPGRRSVEADLPGLRLRALIRDDTDGFEPLRLCTKTGYSGWTYTQKAAGLDVEGELEWEGGRVDLARAGASGTTDWSAGYMRRETFWHWACLAGTLPDGRRVGLNAAAGVNETEYTENCFWVAGRRHALEGVAFEFDRADESAPWRLRSRDGRLDLRFEPAGSRRERLNFGFAASNFKQFFGRFEGELRISARDRAQIQGLRGFVEDHYAKW